MIELDFDDPAVEDRWCHEQRTGVAAYLRSQQVKHGRVGKCPAWYIPPYVSIWAIESHSHPESIGCWVISGDLPTDYISAEEIEPPQHPRTAIRAIAERWLNQVEAWNDGREYEGTRIAGPHSHQELSPLLETRAYLLIEWADDDALWDEQ